MLDLYETFYKLNADPFRLSPDHRFVLDHHSYAKSRSYLEYALHRGEGFIVITGGAGTGKTTLINEVLAQLGKTGIHVATLSSTQLESRDLLHMVAASFGLPQKNTDKAGLLLDLEDFLKQQGQKRRRAVLIVDEAQGLSRGALEELRLLANLQYDNRLLLQVFLIGQEPLRELIGKPEMDHLRQRIVAASNIEPLTLNQTVDYVEHRLNHVGWNGDPEIDAEALTMIHAFSGGIPRKINLICSRLFLYGSMEKKHALTGADAGSVIEGLQQEHLMEPMARQGNGTTGTLSRIGLPAEEFATADIPGLPRGKKTPEPVAEVSTPQFPADRPDDKNADHDADADDEDESGSEIRSIYGKTGQQKVDPSNGERDIWGEIEELKQELEDSYEEFETQEAVTAEADGHPAANQAQSARTVWPVSDDTAASPGRRPVDTAMRAEHRERHGSREDQSRGRGRRIITALLILLAAAGITAVLVFDSGDIEQTVATVNDRLIGPQQGAIQREEAGTEQPPAPPARLPESERPDELVTQGEATPPVEVPPAEAGTGETARVAESGVESVPVATGVETDLETDAATGEADVAGVTIASREERPPADSLAAPADHPVVEPVNENSVQTRGGLPVEKKVVSRLSPATGGAAGDEPVDQVASPPVTVTSEEQKAATEVQQQAGTLPPEETQQAQLEAQRARLREAAEKRLRQRLVARQSATEKKTDEIAPSSGNRLATAEKPKVEPPVPVKAKSRPATKVTAPKPASKPAVTPAAVKSTLLGSDWASRGKPATLLPSEITHCQPQADGLACWSVPQETATRYGPAVYKVEATLGGFSADGGFRLTYRTLVRLITENATGADNSRWQITEHSMTCQLTPLSKILCRDTKGVEREYRRS